MKLQPPKHSLLHSNQITTNKPQQPMTTLIKQLLHTNKNKNTHTQTIQKPQLQIMTTKDKSPTTL